MKYRSVTLSKNVHLVSLGDVYALTVKALRGDFLQNHALFAQNQSDRTD